MGGRKTVHGRAPYKAQPTPKYGAKEPGASRGARARNVTRVSASSAKSTATVAKPIVVQPKVAEKKGVTLPKTQVSVPVRARTAERTTGVAGSVVGSITNAIDALTSNWKEIALITVGSALSVGGTMIMLTTAFFIAGVIMLVCGALLATMMTLTIAKNFDVRQAVNALMQVVRELKNFIKSAMNELDSAESKLAQAKELGDQMSQGGAVLEGHIDGMRSIAEQSKMMDARIRSKHEEMSVLMRDLEKKREEINKDVALLDQALGEVSGMESGLDLLSQTVESVLQLNLSSTRQIKTLIDRLEVLSKDPVVDKRQMAVIIGSIKSILQSQDADETVVEGIRKQIENIKSDFEGLDAIGLRLSEKQDSYNELVEKMTSIKSEIEALYAEGTSTNLQERLEEVTEQFAVLKLLSEEQARHIADSMAGVQNARSSLEQAGAKAEESGQKMDAIKKKAGLATFRDLVLQVGITAAATGAGVMTGGLAYPLLIAAAGHGTMQYKSQITSVPGYVKSGIGSVGSVIGLW